MRPRLTGRTTVHLRIVQVRGHICLRVDEPGVDIACSVGGVGGGSRQDPRDGVIEDCVGHRLEIASIVYEQSVGIELAVANDIWALDPDCARMFETCAVTKAAKDCTYFAEELVRFYFQHQSSLATSYGDR
jgi:hypothetical protein